MVAIEDNAGRLIKPHKKSRAGCGPCKLRKVKCDESKPTCKRCKASGTCCNYNRDNAEKKAALELRLNGSSKLRTIDVISFSLNPASAAGVGRYVFEETDLDLLAKFRNRTTLTITSDRIRGIYQNQIVEIAPINPFLMHSMLALTLMHDRHLDSKTPQPQSTSEAYHQYQSIALFNARLANPTQPSPPESAALWVTATLLGTMAFCHVGAPTAAECWPLAPASPADLSWLTMSEGKTQLRKMTQPFTTEPRFQALAPPSTKGRVPRSSTPAELRALSSALLRFCRLGGGGGGGGADNANPYHAVAATLARSMALDRVAALLSFLVLVSNIPAEYKSLLKRKDPRALLLLACWYVRISELELWWIRPRAMLEGHAICMYLRQCHRDDKELQGVMRSLWDDMRGTGFEGGANTAAEMPASA